MQKLQDQHPPLVSVVCRVPEMLWQNCELTYSNTQYVLATTVDADSNFLVALYSHLASEGPTAPPCTAVTNQIQVSPINPE